VKVIEYGTPETGGQPQVVCHTDESNLSGLKSSLLYRDCVIVERWKYESMLRVLEEFQKAANNSGHPAASRLNLPASATVGPDVE